MNRKKCVICKRLGNNAERFILIKDRLLCMPCAVDIYLRIKAMLEKKSAITGKLEEKDAMS